MTANGFNDEIFVYPSGNNGTDKETIIDLVGKYFKYGLAGNIANESAFNNKGQWNNSIFSSYKKRLDIARCIMSADSSLDTKWYKEMIDNYIKSAGLIILTCHDYGSDFLTGPFVALQKLIAYLKEQDCEFMTVSKALDRIEKQVLQLDTDRMEPVNMLTLHSLMSSSHIHLNTDILNKFTIDSTSGSLLYNNESICEDVSISSDVTNALVNKDDGLYVEDLSTITDIIDSSGDGTKYLSNDGTYKVISSGSNVTVDTDLSTTSENPVQNKVITSAINSIIDGSKTSVNIVINTAYASSNKTPHADVTTLLNQYLFDGTFTNVGAYGACTLTANEYFVFTIDQDSELYAVCGNFSNSAGSYNSNKFNIYSCDTSGNNEVLVASNLQLDYSTYNTELVKMTNILVAGTYKIKCTTSYLCIQELVAYSVNYKYTKVSSETSNGLINKYDGLYVEGNSNKSILDKLNNDDNGDLTYDSVKLAKYEELHIHENKDVLDKLSMSDKGTLVFNTKINTTNEIPITINTSYACSVTTPHADVTTLLNQYLFDGTFTNVGTYGACLLDLDEYFVFTTTKPSSIYMVCGSFSNTSGSYSKNKFNIYSCDTSGNNDVLLYSDIQLDYTTTNSELVQVIPELSAGTYKIKSTARYLAIQELCGYEIKVNSDVTSISNEPGNILSEASDGLYVGTPSGTTYTTLWEGKVYSKNSTIELSESFKNYDQLILCGEISYSSPGINKCQFSILTSDIEPSTICDEYFFFWYANTSSNRYSSLHFTSNTEMIIDTVTSSSSTTYGAFTKIVGIKY